MKMVIDSSAIIALLKKEKGADIVEQYLPDCIISAVNIAEVASFFDTQNISTEKIRKIMSDILPTWEVFDEEQAYIAAGLRKKTYKFGLSLGDRACLALALSKKMPVLTADSVWSKLDLNVKCVFIR